MGISSGEDGGEGEGAGKGLRGVAAKERPVVVEPLGGDGLKVAVGALSGGRHFYSLGGEGGKGEGLKGIDKGLGRLFIRRPPGGQIGHKVGSRVGPKGKGVGDGGGGVEVWRRPEERLPNSPVE